jgi:NAD(P)-dependent dehydrogenase (short-subunit alcohol dehydrogenase family)
VDLGLQGRRAIVTGASRGLRLEISRRLSAEGAVVAMVARHFDELEVAAEGVGRAFAADTQDDESVRSMVGSVASELAVSTSSSTRPHGRPAGSRSCRSRSSRTRRCSLKSTPRFWAICGPFASLYLI